MDQLPCSHAIAVLQKVNRDPYDYCSSYYTKQTMIVAYKELVHPVGKKDTWKVPEDVKIGQCTPPEDRIRTGRPKQRMRKLRGRQICQLNNLIAGNAGNVDIIEELVEPTIEIKKFSYLQIMLQILLQILLQNLNC